MDIVLIKIVWLISYIEKEHTYNEEIHSYIEEVKLFNCTWPLEDYININSCWKRMCLYALNLKINDRVRDQESKWRYAAESKEDYEDLNIEVLVIKREVGWCYGRLEPTKEVVASFQLKLVNQGVETSFQL